MYYYIATSLHKHSLDNFVSEHSEFSKTKSLVGLKLKDTANEKFLTILHTV